MIEFTGWWAAFALTLSIELPIYALLLRKWCRPATGAGIGLLANLLTHRALWVTLGGWDAHGWIWVLGFLGAEIAVWLVEWLVLVIALRHRGAGRGELAAVAGLANLASAGFGLLVQFR